MFLTKTKTKNAVNFTTMVGTTDPLDPNVFPGLGGDSAIQSFVFGKESPYTVRGGKELVII